MCSTNEFISDQVTQFLKYKCFILPQPLFVPTVPMLSFPGMFLYCFVFFPITSMPTKLFFSFLFFLLFSSFLQFHCRSSSGTFSSSLHLALIFAVSSAFFYISNLCIFLINKTKNTSLAGFTQNRDAKYHMSTKPIIK